MKISYRKLWEHLEFSQISKSEFQKTIHVSNGTMGKFNQNEPVSMTIMMRVCEVLHCDIGDVMEIKE